MNEKDIICQYAKELKLATIRENISLFLEDATREQWGYLMFLRRLFEEEVTSRREKSKIIRIHRADFPQMKYLEELKRDELPLEGQMLLPEVETLEFIVSHQLTPSCEIYETLQKNLERFLEMSEDSPRFLEKV